MGVASVVCCSVSLYEMVVRGLWSVEVLTDMTPGSSLSLGRAGQSEYTGIDLSIPLSKL